MPLTVGNERPQHRFDVEASRWMGRPIAELSREELYDVIHHLQKQVDWARETTKSVTDMYRLAARAKERLLDGRSH